MDLLIYLDLTEAERCNERPQTRIFDAMMSDSDHGAKVLIVSLTWLAKSEPGTSKTRVAG